jgi:cbb3-type cytochrome oxidase cytochrome c subunit
MSLRKRDLGFIAVAGSLLLVLGLNTFRDKPKSTPNTDRHRPIREALAKGDRREAVEKGCVNCHSAAVRPLPPKHPPKEQCLICHPFQQVH